MSKRIPRSEALTIVVAWLEDDFRVKKERRADLGERPELESYKIAKTALWLDAGTSDDIAKAERWAASQADKQIKVYVYPATAKKPRDTAAKAILAGQ